MEIASAYAVRSGRKVVLHERVLVWQIFKDPPLRRFTRDGDYLTSLDQGIPIVDANLIKEVLSVVLNLREMELLWARAEYLTQNSKGG